MIQKTRNWAFAAMMIWGIGSSMAQQRNTLFNDDWEFIKEGQEAVTVDLPHDWSILGVPSADEPSGNDGGYYPTGKAQYRKVLHLGQLSPDRRYALYFEGVYMNAEVVVNGVSTGVQHYGYSSFLRDVTKLLHEGF